MNTDHHDPREPMGPERDGNDGAPAVTDAELVRYLDGELTGPAAASLAERIAESAAAVERLDTLRQRSGRLSALLSAADPTETQVRESAAAIRPSIAEATRARDPEATGPSDSATLRLRDPEATRPRRAPTRPVRWRRLPAAARVAAAIALILAAALAVPQARAWVVDRARDVAEAIGLRPAPSPQSATSPRSTAGTPDDADVGVGFAVAGAVFEIQVPRAAGVLIVRRGVRDAGSAEASRAPGTSFVVLPDALRIEGQGAPGAVYDVTLPGTVTSIRIRVAEGPTMLHALPAAGDALRMELDG